MHICSFPHREPYLAFALLSRSIAIQIKYHTALVVLLSRDSDCLWNYAPGVTKATFNLHPQHNVGSVDPRIFGGFLEHMGRAVYQCVLIPHQFTRMNLEAGQMCSML